MNGYDLSRNFWNWAFENPEKITTNHSAIYFFAVEHWNRLGQKTKFGFPSQMTMEAIGIRKHQTYIKYFNELVEYGFFKLIQKSQNQYSANVISLIYAMPKKGKALDKANINHRAKQIETTGQSNGYIDKQVNKETKEQINKEKESIFFEWLNYRKEIKKEVSNTRTYNSLVKRFNKESLNKCEFVVGYSIESNYQGLFWDKYTTKPKQSNKPPKVSF